MQVRCALSAELPPLFHLDIYVLGVVYVLETASALDSKKMRVGELGFEPRTLGTGVSLNKTMYTL